MERLRNILGPGGLGGMGSQPGAVCVPTSSRYTTYVTIV